MTGLGAAGRRVPYESMPASLRTEIEGRLGDRVVEAVTQPGGFSPGVAARVRLAGGGRAFVKAVSAEVNADSPRLHRAEARVAAVLPPAVPAPRFLFAVDEPPWVALAFDDLEGRAVRLPWEQEDLDLVLDAVARLAESLSPSPIEVGPVGDQPLGGWAVLAANPALADRLDPLCRSTLDQLAALETGWGDAAAGDTLLHCDLRADNMVVTDDGVKIVDWPWACIGAPWVDLLFMLPSVGMQGGPQPDEVFDTQPQCRDADPERVDRVLAAAAGFFVLHSLLPEPPALPGLRDFQAAQGRVAQDWLFRRRGWISPR